MPFGPEVAFGEGRPDATGVDRRHSRSPAFAMPHLVTGTDFSAASVPAVRRAAELAARLGLALRVVHVREPLNRIAWSPGPDEAEWLEALGLPEATLDVRHGVPWVELSRAAEEADAPMLVVGTHGEGGYHPVSLGATAARLAVRSRRPLLLVASAPESRSDGNNEISTPTVSRRSETLDVRLAHRRPGALPGDR